MTSDNAQQMTAEDHQMAFTEVSFLIESFANTIDNIMGGATAPVGRIAGREMARKLPLHLDNPSLEQVIALLAKRMQAGFEITASETADGAANVTFGRCALREVCNQRKMQTGSAVCRLFHSYFDGIVNELMHRPVKSEIVETGDVCCIRTRSQ
jgi:DNA-binding transcriptional regulator YbjK